MIEKRFTYKHFDWLQWHIYENGEFYIEVTNSEEDAKKLCDLLNNLSDENEQLKEDNNIFFTKVFDILLKYQDLFNREIADEVLDELGIELTRWFE